MGVLELSEVLDADFSDVREVLHELLSTGRIHTTATHDSDDYPAR